MNDPREAARARLEVILEGPWTLGELGAFHAREKLLLMAHAPARARELGRLLGTAKGQAREAVAVAYREGFLAALAEPASAGGHVNALQHAVGYLRGKVDAAALQEVHDAIAHVGAGTDGPERAQALLRRHAVEQEIDYLAAQTYLEAP